MCPHPAERSEPDAREIGVRQRLAREADRVKVRFWRCGLYEVLEEHASAIEAREENDATHGLIKSVHVSERKSKARKLQRHVSSQVVT